MGKKSRIRKQRREGPAAPSRALARPLPPRSLSARAEAIALVCLLASGLLIRLAYLLEYRSKSVFYDGLILDAVVYDSWAGRIAGGAWLSGPPFYHAPLYPYLLAILYRLFGHFYLPVYLLQMLMGLIVLFLTYRLGRRLASAWVGLAAGILLLVYPALLSFETKIMATTLSVCLALSTLGLLTAAWESGGLPRWFGAGVGVGLSALAHPASLLLAPVFAAGRFSKVRRLDEVAALAVGTLLAVAPATFHNAAAGGGFVLISSQGGITFLQGNSRGSRGLYRPVKGFSGSPLTQEQEEKALAEKEAGHSLRASEISAHWLRKGLAEIRSAPGQYLDLLGLKLVRLVSSHEYTTEYSLSLEREEILSLRILPLPFGFLAVGAAAGALLGWRAFPRLTPIHLYLLATLLPPMLFYVSSRYRIAAAPGLAILSAVAVERLAERFRAVSPAATLPVAASILILGGLTLFPYGRDHLVQEANVHYNVGNLYYDRKEYSKAIGEYQLALSVSDLDFYRINLGNALTRSGRFDEAVEQYRRVASRRPGFAKAYIQWAKALVEQGRVEEAREQYRKAAALGVRNDDLDRRLGTDAAAFTGAEIDTLRRAVEGDPRNASLHNSLGVALQKAGRMDEAVEEYRKASRLDPGYAKPRFNLGLVLERQGRSEEALAEFETAARLQPEYVRAHLRAAAILIGRGDRSRARDHYQAALKVEPTNVEASDGLRRTQGGS